MYRPTTAHLTALYAFLFAFAAMTAIRWPSVMMGVGLLTGETDETDWRALGLAYAAPYLLASGLFFTSAVLVAARKSGAFAAFLAAGLVGFPTLFAFEFSADWWRAPSVLEAGAATAAALTLLLGWAVWDLRRRPKRAIAAVSPTIRSDSPAVEQPPRSRSATPPSAAVLRQRAHYAAEGRKMMARRWR